MTMEARVMTDATDPPEQKPDFIRIAREIVDRRREKEGKPASEPEALPEPTHVQAPDPTKAPSWAWTPKPSKQADLKRRQAGDEDDED